MIAGLGGEKAENCGSHLYPVTGNLRQEIDKSFRLTWATLRDIVSK